jgi:hypothetical protein
MEETSVASTHGLGTVKCFSWPSISVWTAELSLQQAWTEYIILNIENDRDRISIRCLLLLTDLNAINWILFQLCWRHYAGWNRSVTGSPLLLTVRANWILQLHEHDSVHCQNQKHIFSLFYSCILRNVWARMQGDTPFAIRVFNPLKTKRICFI